MKICARIGCGKEVTRGEHHDYCSKACAYGQPKPLCACGCGRRVKAHGRRYLEGCFTSAQRVANLGIRQPRSPRALCACGCGRHVKGIHNRWATPQCVPLETRQASGRASRVGVAVRCRLRLFRAQMDRIKAMGRRVNGDELMAIFQEIHLRGYNGGYNACEQKWLGLSKRRKAAA